LKRWYRYRQEGKTFVYVDESGFAPTTERTHGWALKGQKVYGFRSGNRRPRTSLIAALVNKRLTAPLLFEGTCNTAIFNAWLEQELCPTLDENSVVVIDNAAFHKSKETSDLITATGATLLFLPPYSPELMPIEKTFGTMKKHRSYNEHLSIDEIINVFF
jgi:transposase